MELGRLLGPMRAPVGARPEAHAAASRAEALVWPAREQIPAMGAGAGHICRPAVYALQRGSKYVSDASAGWMGSRALGLEGAPLLANGREQVSGGGSGREVVAALPSCTPSPREIFARLRFAPVRDREEHSGQAHGDRLTWRSVMAAPRCSQPQLRESRGIPARAPRMQAAPGSAPLRADALARGRRCNDAARVPRCVSRSGSKSGAVESGNRSWSAIPFIPP